MERTLIAPGVHLSCDPAEKFNRCRISVHFAFPAKRETATAHALLPLVLERGYADCPDMTRLTKKLAKLYGADLTVDARPMGCSHNLCVSVTGIKDQFALEGETLTREYASIALGAAFHPYFVGGTFDPEAVGIEKQMLKKALEDEINDKRLYCLHQANREFFGDSPAGVRQEGYLEEVEGLTARQLTDAYYEMLRAASIELIVLGCDEASTAAVQDALLAEVKKLADDSAVHGILVQLPLPAQIDEKAVIDAIPPAKDVDGFSPVNVGRMQIGEPCYLPCTPAGCIRMIESTGIDIGGKNAVVIGRSNIVGKPAALLLLAKHATVTICHSKTKNLKEVCAAADILVAAVGREGFVTGDMVKPGAVVIDVGINRGADGKLHGDVNFEEAAEKAAYITPVPGGVGPMTRAMLMLNTVEAAKRQAM